MSSFLNRCSSFLGRWLGRWWLCITLAVVASGIFMYVVPHAVSEVTNGRTLAPKILDEYYPTWSASDARALYAGLGPTGRRAYQLYYLKLDFWFPVLALTLCYISLLSIAFRRFARFHWFNLLPVVMYAADVAENLNHYAMAGSFPELSVSRLAIGPVLSLVKYALITLLPLVAVVGFVANRRVLRASAA
jgi:hypothetical protein